MFTPSPLRRTYAAALRDLRSSKSAVRAAASQDLLGVGTTDAREAAVALVPLLADAEGSVRAAAVTTLGGLDARHLLDAIAAWPHDPRFDDADRACLAFTEHYVIDVASVGDDTVAEVRAHLGDSGLAEFVSALLVVEQRMRLRLAWARLSLDADTGTPTTEGDH